MVNVNNLSCQELTMEEMEMVSGNGWGWGCGLSIAGYALTIAGGVFLGPAAPVAAYALYAVSVGVSAAGAGVGCAE